MRRFAGILLGLFVKLPMIIILSVGAIIVLNSVCVPVYKFVEPKPFSGSGFYNPYADFDTTRGLQKANFHAHSKINEVLNGNQTIEEVVEAYEEYSYDIIGVSNYQTISRHAEAEDEHVPVYEHGYNPYKFHQLVFGHDGLTHRDAVFPVTASARQWMILHTAKNADAVCVNHPNFTTNFEVEHMKYLRGYRFIEADAGMSPAFRWWDEALSSGIPSFILSGDDSHDVSDLHDVATHGVVINTSSKKYKDIIGELKRGNFYAIRVPDFNDKYDSPEMKRKKVEFNKKLPNITDLGLRGDTLFVELSDSARAINFIGQGGLVEKTQNGKFAEYALGDKDTYIRIDVEFENGVKFHTNPFFRTDSSDPFQENMPTVNLFLTTLLVLGRLGLVALFGWLVYILARRLFGLL